MCKDEVREIIKDIVRANIENEEVRESVTDEDIISTLGGLTTDQHERNIALSSLEIVTIIVDIEEKFNIDISDEMILSFKTINDLAEMVNRIINNEGEHISPDMRDIEEENE